MYPKITLVIGSLLNFLSIFNKKWASKLAFDLFCRPFAPKLKPAAKEWLEAAYDGTILSNEEKIHSYKWGVGKKKMLFLHGWRSSTHRWAPYIDRIDLEEYTAHAIDAPAHGLSGGTFFTMVKYAEAMNQWCQKNGAPDVIIGHSIGAMSAIYAVTEFEAVSPKKLILLAPGGRLLDFLEYYEGVMKLGVRIQQGMIDYIKANFKYPPEHYDSISMAKRLTMDGLIIHDKNDQVSLVGNAEQIHQSWPQSELVVTDGLGHKLISEDVYDKVLAASD